MMSPDPDPFSRRLDWRYQQESEHRIARMKQFLAQCHNDPFVVQYLNDYLNGHFESFEMMLVELTVALVRQNERYHKMLQKAISLAPPDPIPVTVKPREGPQ